MGRRPSLPEVFLSHNDMKDVTREEMKAGRIRKIGPHLYTTDLRTPVDRLVRRNLWSLVSAYFPGALIADRTAFENRPAEDGSVFVVSERVTEVNLPGLRIRPRPGVGALPTDNRYMGNLHLSSPGRAVLENMLPSRARSGASRTTGRRGVEDYLEGVLRMSGADQVNRIRDEARSVAGALGLDGEFRALNTIVGALLGTEKDDLIQDPAARARASGLPCDPRRLEAFEALRADLAARPPRLRPVDPEDAGAMETAAFFEAYFSNFIEGTEFEVEEAFDIVFRGVIPAARPQDAHDVLGTFRVVSGTAEMNRLPRDAGEFEALLKSRHHTVMSSRQDKRPGNFKVHGNRAGEYSFVAPDLVRGTLAKGFEFYRSLADAGPFARAAFMMFLVSEVHPFEDGNGRVARIMMNAELAARGQHRIIIPTVFRNEYLDSLRALSQNHKAAGLFEVLNYAQRYVSVVPWRDYAAAYGVLDATGAFMKPNEADRQGIRLRIPSPEVLLRIERAEVEARPPQPPGAHTA